MIDDPMNYRIVFSVSERYNIAIESSERVNNLFSVGMPEMIMVLVIALVVFGPGKLPEVGKAIGKGINEFRRATTLESKEGSTSTGSPDTPSAHSSQDTIKAEEKK